MMNKKASDATTKHLDQPSNSSCMVRLQTREQLDTARDVFPFLTEAYLSDQCGHCNALKPVLEKECKETGSLMPVPIAPTVVCPVSEPFCREELVKKTVDEFKRANNITGKKLTKKQKEALDNLAIGVPFVSGAPRGGAPVFAIHGNDPDAVKNVYGTLRGLITKAKDRMDAENTTKASK